MYIIKISSNSILRVPTYIRNIYFMYIVYTCLTKKIINVPNWITILLILKFVYYNISLNLNK